MEVVRASLTAQDLEIYLTRIFYTWFQVVRSRLDAEGWCQHLTSHTISKSMRPAPFPLYEIPSHPFGNAVRICPQPVLGLHHHPMPAIENRAESKWRGLTLSVV